MVKLDETTGDQWSEMADYYNRLTVDVGVRPVGFLLEKANEKVRFSEATAILDNGCGPGPVVARLLKDYNVPESASITCSDFSGGMIKQVEKRKHEAVEADENSPWKRVETMTQDATNLEKTEDSSKSHVTASWVYFMTPDPFKCLTESRRVLKDGGVLACSAWKGSQWLDLMNLVPKIAPDAKMPELPKEWMNAAPMKAELEKAGFKDVDAYEVETTMKFEKLDELNRFMFHKLPHMQMLTKDFSDDKMERLIALANEEGRKMAPNDPGELSGVALVAVGRK